MNSKRRVIGQLILLAGLCLGLNSCGSLVEDAGFSAKAGYTPRTYEQEMPNVCGANKTSGIQGVDVSYYQGNFNWAGVKSSKNIKFGYARISDGLNYVDDKFDRNWSEMKNQGILRGAYQYFRPGQDATAQANMVVNKVGQLGTGDLPVMLDIESTDNQSKATIVSKMKTWLNVVERGTGKKPVIYTGPYFWQDSISSTEFGGYKLWIAHYGASCPLVPAGWDKWTFWQYCGGDQYCPNGEAYDCDVFNGSQAELEELAGAGSDWGASYVEQTFPLAAEPVKLVPGEKLSGYIELKNTGSKTWNSDVKLATTEPRDRNSVFADSSWLAPNRPAGVSGDIEPGKTFKFEFDFRAPNELGSYHEFFTLVKEGGAWFSDSGQGGPPDDQLQVWIEVVKADYAAKFIGHSFGEDADILQMEEGGTVDGWIELENTGDKAWTPEKTRLAPTPRDEASPFYDDSWLSETRVSAPDAKVEPGEKFKFPVTLTASEIGQFTQTFGLIHEDTTWFADSPKGGGPADDAIAIEIIVGDVEPAPVDPPGSDAGPGEDIGIPDAGNPDPGNPDAGSQPPPGEETERTELGPVLQVSEGSSAAGCSQASNHPIAPANLAFLLLGSTTLLIMRRRRA